MILSGTSMIYREVQERLSWTHTLSGHQYLALSMSKEVTCRHSMPEADLRPGSVPRLWLVYRYSSGSATQRVLEGKLVHVDHPICYADLDVYSSLVNILAFGVYSSSVIKVGDFVMSPAVATLRRSFAS